MQTLTRYILKEFLKPLIFTSLTFVGLYLISEIVDSTRMWLEHSPSFILVILYYIYCIPYFLVQIMPMAVLLASLFSLGQLARNNELIAMRSCGVDFFRIVKPILITAIFIVGIVLVFNEIVIPYTNSKARYIKKVKIQKKNDDIFKFRKDWVTRTTSGNRILHTKHLDAYKGTMREILLLELGPNLNIKRRIDAEKAVWQVDKWIFNNGTIRIFDNKGAVISFENFKNTSISFKENPRDFIREKKKQEQLLSMPLKELHYRINLLKDTGIDPKLEEVHYHLKISFPFANFILVLLGISLPFIFPTGKRAMIWAAIGFIITIITAFFYIGFIAVGTSLGKSGILPPIISVWISNIIFICLGVYLIYKAKA